MKFTLSFNTDNDAFYNDENGEIARILHAVADKVHNFNLSAFHSDVRDSNGNIIGTYVLKEAA